MAVVTGIRRFRKLVYVQLDGREFACIREKDFAAWPLEEGDAVSEEAYREKIASAQLKEATAAVIALLEGSDKTKEELKRALMRRGFVDMAAQAAVDRAEEQRFVDDRRYAKRVVEKSASRDVGMYALKQRLRAKGVGEEEALEALEAMDETQQREACARALRKIRSRYCDKPAREARAKCAQALARRGFSWDVISFVLDGAFLDDDWEE